MPKKIKKLRKVEPEEDEIFDIKKIHKYDIRDGKDFYLVEWDGYPLSDATWEPRSSFDGSPEEILKKMVELKKEYHDLKASGGTPKHSSKRKVPTTNGNNSTTPDSRSVKRKRSDENFLDSTPKHVDESDSSLQQITKQDSKRRAAEVAQNAQVIDQRKQVASPRTISASKERDTSSSQSGGRQRSTSIDSPRDAIVSEFQAKVKAIKKDDTHGLVAVVVSLSDAGEVEEKRLKMDEVRKLYPDELIEFLLQRIQFRQASSPQQTTSGKRGC